MKTNLQKHREEIVNELFDAGKRYGEDIGYVKHEMLYEMRSSAIQEAKTALTQDILDLLKRVMPERSDRAGGNPFMKYFDMAFNDCLDQLKSNLEAEGFKM